MLSDEEKQTIEYLKARLYGNEGCKIIDVAQSDLRIFLKLVENLQKDIENWKKYCDEQENDITLKNNKICDLEFKIEKQSKEIEELNKNMNLLREQNISYKQSIHGLKEMNKIINKKWEDKIKAKIEELDKEEQDLQNSIGAEEREEYSDANISFGLMDIYTRREVLQSLLEDKE